MLSQETNHHNMPLLLADNDDKQELLTGLAQGLNQASTALAASQLLDPQATQHLAWCLQEWLLPAYQHVYHHHQEEEQEQEEQADQEQEDLHDDQEDLDEQHQGQDEEMEQVEEDISMDPLPTYEELQAMRDESTHEISVKVLPVTSCTLLPPRLFSHVFVVQPPRPNQEMDLLNALGSMVALALHNLALARYVQASSSSSNTMDKMQVAQLRREAMAFWMQAHDLIDKSIPSPDGTTVYVYMAVCQNLALLTPASAEEEQEQNRWQQALQACLWTMAPHPTCPLYRQFAEVAAMATGSTTP